MINDVIIKSFKSKCCLSTIGLQILMFFNKTQSVMALLYESISTYTFATLYTRTPIAFVVCEYRRNDEEQKELEWVYFFCGKC